MPRTDGCLLGPPACAGRSPCPCPCPSSPRGRTSPCLCLGTRPCPWCLQGWAGPPTPHGPLQ
eukprot:12894694-Prorocentrum_lima.AAC.1